MHASLDVNIVNKYFAIKLLLASDDYSMNVALDRHLLIYLDVYQLQHILFVNSVSIEIILNRCAAILLTAIYYKMTPININKGIFACKAL